MTDASHLDGNALGGPLGEIFAVDLTAAMTTCATCRDVGPVAGLMVYMDAPGAVGRCPTCGSAQVRLAASAERWWLDLSGVRALEIPRPPS
jgi:hypothetical protein